MSAVLHIGLLHFPVLDRQGLTVTTSVVNYDLHDLARAGKTYGVESYFVITPLRSQILLVERLVEHWTEGWGKSYNPNRKEALDLIRIQPTLEAALEELTARGGGVRPVVWATSAQAKGSILRFSQARKLLQESERPHLLLFGTGWGMTPEALAQADALLEPVLGVGPYNHLSVRAAAAIILDRLRGQPWEGDS